MNTFEINTDYNGLVLFDPVVLKSIWPHEIVENDNIFESLMSSDLGDLVTTKGAVIPIIAIDDGGYTINLSVDGDIERNDKSILFQNGAFPIEVRSTLFLADLAVFREWEENTDWINTKIAPGFYSVTLRGYCEKNSKNEIEDCGFDILLVTTGSLPIYSADSNQNNRVMI